MAQVNPGDLRHIPFHAQSLTRPSLPVQTGLQPHAPPQVGTGAQQQQQQQQLAFSPRDGTAHDWMNPSTTNSPTSTILHAGSGPTSPWSSIFDNAPTPVSVGQQSTSATLYNHLSPRLSDSASYSPRDIENAQMRYQDHQKELEREREQAMERERIREQAGRENDEMMSTTNDFINPLSYNLPFASGYDSVNGIFHSSYGSYQPSVGPFARFLTPSPGPSVLGQFDDLEDPVEFSIDGPAPPATGNSNDGGSSQGHARDEGIFDLWAEHSRRTGTDSTDPFAGMVLASNSDPNSPKPVPLAFPMPPDGGLAGRYEQSTMSDLPHLPPSLPVGFAGGLAQLTSAAGISTSFYQPANSYLMSSASPSSPHIASPSHHSKHLPTPASSSSGNAATPQQQQQTDSPSSIKLPLKRGRPTKSSLTMTNENGETVQLAKKPKREKSMSGSTSKKNRNPHATQLPGGSTNAVVMGVGGAGGEGEGSNPVCSHCSSVSTPLWRRGPDDELLCNACGLYQKLHQKPRPKGFLKQPAAQRGRGSAGVGAQANSASVPPICSNCSATSTPMWRKDQEGNLNCNACSLYFKLHQIPRPVSLSQRRKMGSSAPTPAAAVPAPSTSVLPADSNLPNPPVIPAGNHSYQAPTPSVRHRRPRDSKSLSPSSSRSRSISPTVGEPRVPTPLVPSGNLPPISSFTDDWSAMDRPPTYPMPNVDRPPVIPTNGVGVVRGNSGVRTWDHTGGGMRRNSPFSSLASPSAESDMLMSGQRFRVDESWERGLSPAGRVE